MRLSLNAQSYRCVPTVLWQEKYAGLDSYAGVLLFYHIWARMDPILTKCRPDVLSLPANTHLRLYTSTNTRCVAEGTLEEYSQGGTWGSTGLTIGRVTGGATRMVVRLTVKHVPGAFVLHPGEGGGQVQALEELELGALVLWDAVSWVPGTVVCAGCSLNIKIIIIWAVTG